MVRPSIQAIQALIVFGTSSPLSRLLILQLLNIYIPSGISRIFCKQLLQTSNQAFLESSNRNLETMPHTVNACTESAANKAIGGFPFIHHFDFQSRGRGQVV